MNLSFIFAPHFSGCSVARSSRLLWEQEVAGSNPATPTKSLLELQGGFFYFRKTLIANNYTKIDFL
jgi:hypothetical protein